MNCAGSKRAGKFAGHAWLSGLFGILIATMAALLLLASPPAVAQFATGPNQGIAGEWDWGAGGGGNVVVIWGNGAGRGGEGNALSWTLVDPIARHYRLVWSNSRFVDEAELTVDGNTLLIVNNDGVRFTATRRGASGTGGPIAPVQPPAAGGPNQGIAGEWDWPGGGNVVVIWANGSGRGGEGNALNWTLVDPVARHYRLVWGNSRFIDDAELTADGNMLVIVNNDGVHFTATRHGTPGTGGPIAPTQPPGAGGPNLGIAGQWDWGVGGSGNIVVIWGNGIGSDSAGNTMQWQLLDPVARHYRLTWSHGFVDEGDLTVDGQKLLLVNNVGTRFVGTRRSASGVAGGSNPPPPPPPPSGGMQPGDVGTGGYLPAGQDSYDSTSISAGDPFNGGTWSNSQNGRAFAQRFLMPPVCISGFTLESAGSDMSTRGATIRIELISPYGGHFNALDLRGVAVNRDFSPGGSGDVVPPQSAGFPPFQTSRIDVEMRGHGWFLMKGLRFNVVQCP